MTESKSLFQAIRRRWRRLWCGHFYDRESGRLDAYPYTTWVCVRGCGKRKLTFGDEIPMSFVAPGETVVDDRPVAR